MILKGKTAVITGSNSGIGLGVAIELARAGADIVVATVGRLPRHPAVRCLAARTPD